MKNLYIFFVIFLLAFRVYGQAPQPTASPSLLNVIPPSPTAAALGKYGEIPVSLYTGVPNISIPLYEINEGDIKLPISLSYHAGGIKVEEIASNVGLGWSLNAGGVITRTVRGLPDDEAGGYFDKIVALKQKKYVDHRMDISEQYQYTHEVSNSILDSEPDIFNINFPGISAKFYLKYQIEINATDYNLGNYDIIMLTQANIKIEYIANNKSWIITDDKGTKYYFEVHELTSNNKQGAVSMNISSWYIRKINDISNNSITFLYDDYDYEAKKAPSYIESYATSSEGVCACKNISKSNIPSFQIDGKKLREIISENTKIVLLTTSLRTDMNYLHEPANREGELSKLIISSNNTFLKSYDLVYNYGRSRLMLDKLIEKDKVGNEISPYSFTYNITDLPSTDPSDDSFYNQDHWGFYNSNQYSYLKTLSPRTILRDGRVIEGADRQPDRNRLQSSILTQITYPTGGKTQFEYEANDYSEIISDISAHELCDNIEEYHNVNISLSCSQNISALNCSKTQRFTIAENTCVYISSKVSTNTEGQTAELKLHKITQPTNTLIHLSCPKVRVDGQPCEMKKNGTMVLTSGEYEIYLETHGNTNDIGAAFASFEIKYFDKNIAPTNTSLYRLAGGLRIKSIKHFNSVTNNHRIQKYTYKKIDTENKAISSGVLSHYFKYSHDEQVLAFCESGNSNRCEYTTIYGYSQIALAIIQGSSVVYSDVMVEESNNGKEIYKYTTPLDQNIRINFSFPFVPLDLQEWRYGMLKEKTIYKDGEIIIQKQINKYFTRYKSISDNVKIVSHYPPAVTLPSIVTNFYKNSAGLSQLIETTNITYSQTPNVTSHK